MIERIKHRRANRASVKLAKPPRFAVEMGMAENLTGCMIPQFIPYGDEPVGLSVPQPGHVSVNPI